VGLPLKSGATWRLVLVLALYIYQFMWNIVWPLVSVGNLALLVMAFVVVSAFNRLIRLAET
jgi:hypothetical protein